MSAGAPLSPPLTTPGRPARASAPPWAPHARRIIDPDSGLTKGDLVRYYEAVAEPMMRWLRGRPVALVRAPAGLGGKTFFQRHLANPPPGIVAVDPALWPGHEALLVIESPAGVLAAVRLNTIEFHTANVTIAAIDRPDRMVFDLDPGEGIDLDALKRASLDVRDRLADLGLACWIKTSGGRGFHLVVPLEPTEPTAAVLAFSRAVVDWLARREPDRFVARAGAANRVGRIFVDYLRNGEGQSTICALSARARPGLGVSMPFAWRDLEALPSASPWSIRTAPAALARRRIDPWQGYDETRQNLAEPRRRLEALAAAAGPG